MSKWKNKATQHSQLDHKSCLVVQASGLQRCISASGQINTTAHYKLPNCRGNGCFMLWLALYRTHTCQRVTGWVRWPLCTLRVLRLGRIGVLMPLQQTPQLISATHHSQTHEPSGSNKAMLAFLELETPRWLFGFVFTLCSHFESTGSFIQSDLTATRGVEEC